MCLIDASASPPLWTGPTIDKSFGASIAWRCGRGLDSFTSPQGGCKAGTYSCGHEASCRREVFPRHGFRSDKAAGPAGHAGEVEQIIGGDYVELSRYRVAESDIDAEALAVRTFGTRRRLCRQVVGSVSWIRSTATCPVRARWADWLFPERSGAGAPSSLRPIAAGK
jgi:hypothetical protein